MNYSTIIDTALKMADRQDQQLSDLMPVFIVMVENRLNNLMTIEQSSKRMIYPSNPADGRYTLPTDFKKAININKYPAADPSAVTTLQRVSPEQMQNYIGNDSVVNRAFYCIVGNQLTIYPFLAADFNLELIYDSRLVPLSTFFTTNWLSDNNPNAYIFGLLVEINSYVKDATAASLWDARFESTVDEINSFDDQLKVSGTSLQIRLG